MVIVTKRDPRLKKKNTVLKYKKWCGRVAHETLNHWVIFHE